MHSLYALALGLGVIFFASKGFTHARWLTLSLGVVWVVLIFFFRIYKSGKERKAVEGTGEKLRFYVMTYVLKNMYQGMLFFLLPFYWRSATFGTPNQWFVIVLGVCAFLATLDLVFDQVLMRYKVVASLFYLFTLFACVNLIIPAALPTVQPHVALLAAAAVAHVVFWTIHVPPKRLFRPVGLALLIAGTAGVTAGVHLARIVVPPASMWIDHAAVGPRLMDDGRLAIEADRIAVDAVDQLHAITDIAAPVGMQTSLHHVWRRDGETIWTTRDIAPEPSGRTDVARLRSTLPPTERPQVLEGAWSVDIVTAKGQLVGRAEFELID